MFYQILSIIVFFFLSNKSCHSCEPQFSTDIFFLTITDLINLLYLNTSPATDNKLRMYYTNSHFFFFCERLIVRKKWYTMHYWSSHIIIVPVPYSHYKFIMYIDILKKSHIFKLYVVVLNFSKKMEHKTQIVLPATLPIVVELSALPPSYSCTNNNASLWSQRPI